MTNFVSFLSYTFPVPGSFEECAKHLTILSVNILIYISKGKNTFKDIGHYNIIIPKGN